MANKFFNFSYDPARSGYDTDQWKATTGTPAASGNYLRLNEAGVIHLKDLLRGEFTFGVIVPADPTSGDSRQIGLTQIGKDVYAYFDITDTVFSAKTSDGTNSKSVTLDWDSDWSTATTDFTIRWEAGLVMFFINGTCVATISNNGDTTYVPNDVMSLYIANAGSDNMDVAYVEAKGVQSYV